MSKIHKKLRLKQLWYHNQFQKDCEQSKFSNLRIFLLSFFVLAFMSSSIISHAQCPVAIQVVGEPDLCTLIDGDASHPLATLDCDQGGVDNITECTNMTDPTDPADDIPCDLEITANEPAFGATVACRYDFTIACVGCDGTYAGTIDFDISDTGGTSYNSGSTTYNGNSRTQIGTYFWGLLGCGSTIQFDRKVFATAFPAAHGQDLVFTLIFDLCCPDTLVLEYERLHATSFDNQSSPEDYITGNSCIDAVTGDFQSCYGTAAWPPVTANGGTDPAWSVGGWNYIKAGYFTTGVICDGNTRFDLTTVTNPNLVVDQVTIDGVTTTLTSPPSVPLGAGIHNAGTFFALLNPLPQFVDLMGGIACIQGLVNYKDIVANATVYNACTNWQTVTAPNRFDGLRVIDSVTGDVIMISTHPDASVDFGY